ncbi:AEC family transporter [Xinfangfangia sp. D13-10-4-6]|uniref:AEC family transporter n=1 Tax=Pseudogemmobacter hezensis TaxID=2737662 RepID=UPI001551E8DC|nr:AEC family transporter [Pseudogemmobacter hezensis]NPD13682.1 AEC family transporter [Pseudogemmobacter hezensis]
MSALLDVILPVFLLIGCGWLAARFGGFSESHVDGLMKFAQSYALPCVLFRGVAELDLSAAYDPGLMLSFYIAAFAGFAICFSGALWLFQRPLTDAIAIGFAGMFSNSLLLGLPITERAYGPEALAGNFAIISIHSPLFYGLGISLMEWAKSRDQGISLPRLLRKIANAILHQPLVVGIIIGFVVNLSGIGLPGPVWSGVNMLAMAALPAALFGLGGVLWRYRPEGDRWAIVMVCVTSLVIHPALAWSIGRGIFGVSDAALRSLVLTAAMAPGANAYMFAHMYGVAKRVNASAVLFGTAFSILSVWIWLQLLP